MSIHELYLKTPPNSSLSDAELDQLINVPSMTLQQQYALLLSVASKNKVTAAAYIDYLITNQNFNKDIQDHMKADGLLTLEQQFFLNYDKSTLTFWNFELNTWFSTPIPFAQKVLIPSLEKYLVPECKLYVNVYCSMIMWFLEIQQQTKGKDEELAAYFIRLPEYEPDEYTDLYMCKTDLNSEMFAENALYQLFLLSCQYRRAFNVIMYPVIMKMKDQKESSVQKYIYSQYEKAEAHLKSKGFEGFHLMESI